jgi:hypothetical protein
VGEGRESQFGRWLRAGQSSNRFDDGSGGRFNSAWRSFEQRPSPVETDQFEKREEQGRQSDATGEEEDDGDSMEALAAPVRTKGATSALRPNWQSPINASVNHGVQGRQIRKESMTEKIGERQGVEMTLQQGVIPDERGKDNNGKICSKGYSSSSHSIIPGEGCKANNGQNHLKGNISLTLSVNPGEGGKENNGQFLSKESSIQVFPRITEGESEDSNGQDSGFNVVEKNNSPKTKNVYIGQWDSIKEKMVWAFMEGDEEKQHDGTAGRGRLHVVQQKQNMAINEKEEGVYVEGEEAMHGPMKSPLLATAPTQTSWKRSLCSPDGSDNDEGDRIQTGKRKKIEKMPGEYKEGGKNNRQEVVGKKKGTGKKAAAARQPRQSQ